MSDREIIYIEDTLPVEYECRRTDPDDPYNSRGLPAEPASAYARIRSATDAQYLPIGGAGVFTAPATIEPMDIPNDRGAILRFLVDSEFTLLPGDYRLAVTAVYADGVIDTEVKR